MLPYKERGRLPIELFATACAADIDTCLTADADAFDLAEFVVHGSAWQVVGHSPTAVFAAPPLAGWRFLFGFVGRLVRRRALAGGQITRSVIVVGEQQKLIRIETLAARPIESLQEQVHALLRLLQIVVALPQRDHQFQDHLLERFRVVGELFERRQRGPARANRFRRTSRRAHTDKTQLPRKYFTKNESL